MPAPSTLPAPRTAAPGTRRRTSTVGGRSRVGSGPRSTRTLTLTVAPAATPLAARRAPFVAVVLLLVGLGLVTLLVLNTAIAADSFTRRALSQDIDQLQLREQQLQLEVAAAQAPTALARAAAGQGMIPAGQPGFLVIHPDGTTEIVGGATPAARPASRSAPPRQPQPPAPPPGGAQGDPPPGGQQPADPADPAAPGGTG